MVNTVPQMLKSVTEKHPDLPAQYYRTKDNNFESLSFKELYTISLDFAAGLLSLGVKRGEPIGLLADNRKEWQQADMGIMAIGAMDVPRGCDATEPELKFMYRTTECRFIVVENESQAKKVLGFKSELPNCTTFISFDPISEETLRLAKAAGVTVYLFSDVVSLGQNSRKENPGKVEAEVGQGQKDDLACIIFTSGTTGEPKGVMLTHNNFLSQLEEIKIRIHLEPGYRALSVLPIWHSFERLCEYAMLIQGASICYSKPVGSILLADFQKLNPHIIPAVPRIFEAIYDGVYRTMRKTGGIVLALFNFFVAVAVLHSKIDRKLFRNQGRMKKDSPVLNWIFLCIPWLLLYPLKALGGVIVFKKIRAKVGKNFIGGVSGGGALPPVIDEFFWAVGINVVEGYGLTETAPVVAVRDLRHPIFGTIGKPLDIVEVRIVDEDGNVLPKCTKGIVQVKGPIVMKGYYKRPDLTAKVLKDGWFDTGDIGLITYDGEIILKGRMKDTIVLRGGENVEPLAIEMRLNNCRYISQSMVVGQDQRYLAALIVPAEDEIKAYAKENNISYSDYKELLENPEIKKLIDTDIQENISAKHGFKLFEKISRFAILSEPFVVGETLSAKQEIMRHKINAKYAKEIASLYE